MFEKVLVPTDFSAEADSVLDFVVGMQIFGVKEIVLTHVMEIGEGPDLPVAPDIIEALESKLMQRQTRLESAGFTVWTELATGIPVSEIERIVDEKKCSLIVTGSHGKLRIEETFFGSVSEELLRRSTVPVLLLRYEMFKRAEGGPSPAEWGAGMFGKVLFPSDFSPTSAGALAELEELEKLKRAGLGEIVALHVIDSRRMETETENHEQMDACYADCGAIMEKLQARGLAVSTLCAAGDPTDRILKVAEEVGATLILMGSHGRGMVGEWLDGSVSLGVLRQADRPVMVVRPAA